jgi:mannose-1-phosphate guanylyltransferase
MKAVILAGGQATRLQPLTCNTPKSMIPVLNVPFLEWVVKHLLAHDIKELVIAQAVLPKPVQDHFKDGSNFGVSMEYIQEKEPLGTAGAINNAASHIKDTFLVLNGDILHDFDYTDIVRYHRAKKAKATIALIPVEDPTQYGLIETDTEGKITSFVEKPEKDQITTNLINAGIYVFEPEVLDYIPNETRVSVERQTFPQMLRNDERLFAYSCRGYWMDTGTPEKYLQLHRDLFAGKSTLYSLPAGKDVLIGDGCRIHSTAEIKGPALIGKNCTIGGNVKITGPVVLGPGCTIFPDCTIDDSILWHNVLLERYNEVHSSIIANNCHLQEQSILQNAVIGDKVIIHAESTPEPGAKIWREETYRSDH